jgi:hypothetical protein
MEYIFMTPSKLWSDYDPEAEGLDVIRIDETECDGVVTKKVYFTSEKTADGEVKVYCSISYKSGTQPKAALVYAGDLFSGSDGGLVSRLAREGYAVADVDFAGRDGSRYHTVYPQSLLYAKPERGTGRLFEAALPSAKSSPWYVWAKMIKRAAVFLKKEYPSSEIGLLAEKTTTTAAYMAAGSYDGFSVLVTLFGAGYTAYRGIYKYGDKSIKLDEKKECYIAGIEGQTYAKSIEIPTLMMLATNSGLSDFDRSSDLFDLLAGEKNMIVSPRLRNGITPLAANAMLLWLNKRFLEQRLKKNPEGKFFVSEGKDYFSLSTADANDAERAEVYYSTTDALPYYREWKNAKAEETAGGEYFAKIEVEGAKIVFAFGNLFYKDGSVVSTKLCVKRIEGKAENGGIDPKKRIIFSRDTGINFIPVNRADLITEDGLVSLKEGAYGIFGIGSQTGGMANYEIGSASTENIAALQADVYALEPKTITVGLYKYSGEESDGKYTLKLTLPADTEWQRISLEPRMFKDEKKRYAENFDGVKILDISDAEGILFNNILFV